MDAEQVERKAANIAWLKQAFAEAKTAGSRGLVILSQANPGFENSWPASAKTRYFLRFVPRGQPVPSRPLAFGDYVQTLAEELETDGKPVAVLHGETNILRMDKPVDNKKTKGQ